MDRHVAFVTGGGSGIGAATARRLAGDGFAVFVNDLDIELCAKVAADIGGQAMPFDVTDPDAFRTAIDTVVADTGRLDVLVNNAGILGLRADAVERRMSVSLAVAAGAPPTPVNTLTTITSEELLHMLAVHVCGTFNGMQAALAHMQETRSGRIVNMASIAALRPFPAAPHYAAAKAAVAALTRSVAFEVAPLGIRVNAVAPGFVDTPLLSIGQRADLGTFMRDYLNTRIGVGRLGSPDEVASVVSFLAGPDASFMVGEIVTVTGGDLGD